MNLSELQETGAGRGTWRAAVHGLKESDRTRLDDRGHSPRDPSRPRAAAVREIREPEPQEQASRWALRVWSSFS